MRRAVLVLTRLPQPGQAKTRLIPRLGAEGAAELQRCMLLDVLDLLASLPATETVVAYTPPKDGQELRSLVQRPLLLLPQRWESLGERMAEAIADVFSLGFRPVVAVGSDLPTLSLSAVEATFLLLEEPTADVVLGPTPDGGYYLMGLIQPQPELLTEVSMGHAGVLAETRSRAQASGLQVALVAPGSDVDTPKDLLRLQEELAAYPPNAGQRTRQFLLEA